MLTRGSGKVGLDPALAVRPLRAILVEPLEPLPKAVYRDGVAVVTVRTERACDAAHGAKVGNYLGSLLALREARAQGAHEALILDTAGRVVEGTTSNVFIVRGGEISTPPAEAGILLGITRAHVIELCAELGRELHEVSLLPDDIASAEEAFVSSPVVRVDDRVVGDGRPGPVTRALHAAFRARAGLGAEPMPWE
jgi:branched-chain amino acid aminotransferase